MMNNPSLAALGLRAAVIGALIAGTADLFYAFTAYGFLGVSPARILYSIAAGWLGKAAALEGGFRVALLGFVSHYCILLVAAGIYVAVASRFPLLTQRPVVCGATFGLCIFVVMNYVVVPLSAAGGPGPTGLFLVMGLFVHAFMIGVPIALVARHFARRTAREAGPAAARRQHVAAPPT